MSSYSTLPLQQKTLGQLAQQQMLEDAIKQLNEANRQIKIYQDICNKRSIEIFKLRTELSSTKEEDNETIVDLLKTKHTQAATIKTMQETNQSLQAENDKLKSTLAYARNELEETKQQKGGLLTSWLNAGKDIYEVKQQLENANYRIERIEPPAKRFNALAMKYKKLFKRDL